jgi:hypothetical protein
MTAYEKYQAALKQVRQARYEYELDMLARSQVIEGRPPKRCRKIRPKPNLRLIVGGRS